MMSPNPFHEGETYVQQLTGERDLALRNGALVAEAVPSRAISFLAQQQMLAVGSVDVGGAVWASLIFGAPGFVTSAAGDSVVVDRTRIAASDDDPFWRNLQGRADIGLLAVELSTRRRLRMNGIVDGLDDRFIHVRIREAYPNCPKYIQRRHSHEKPAPHAIEAQPPAWGVTLDEARTRIVEQADTLFVASRHPTRGVDVSHRGGERGFARVLDGARLRIPDYRGNSMFNTFGNFVVDNRAGLVIPDFERGRLLLMTGTAEVRFDEKDDPRQPTGGTGRYWYFDLAGWLELPIMKPLAWELADYSPYNPSATE